MRLDMLTVVLVVVIGLVTVGRETSLLLGTQRPAQAGQPPTVTAERVHSVDGTVVTLELSLDFLFLFEFGSGPTMVRVSVVNGPISVD